MVVIAKDLVAKDEAKIRVRVRFPLSLPMGTKKQPNKKFHLNKNVERNAHFQVLNKAKQMFSDNFIGQVGTNNKPCKNPVVFFLTIYKKTKRSCDIGNYSIVEKFAADALVKANILEDDNYNHVQGIFYFWGGFAEEDYCLFEVQEL